MALVEITETRTYLTFTLDQEDFAVDVSGVREVLDYTSVTRVPRTPAFMKGVINLRGSVVPVVDMRLKFGLPEAEKTVDTCVIVLEVEMDGEVTVIGAIADSVKEVFELESRDIEPPPRLGTRFETEFISGMGKHNDNFIIILDVNRVFSTQEMELFRQAEEGMTQVLPDSEKHVKEMPKAGAEPSGKGADSEKDKKALTDEEPEMPEGEKDDVKPEIVQSMDSSPKSSSPKTGRSAKKTGKPPVQKT